MSVYQYTNKTSGILLIGPVSFNPGESKTFVAPQAALDKAVPSSLDRTVDGALDNNPFDDLGSVQAALTNLGLASGTSQVFDSAQVGFGPGTYSFVVPADVHVYAVDASSGGGGGGGAGTSSGNGGAGGGGAGVGVKDYLISVIPGSTLTIVVGDGGIAGVASTGAGATGGGDGGDTTISGALDAFPTLFGGLGSLTGGVGGSGGNCLSKTNGQGGAGGQVPGGSLGLPPSMMQQTASAITTTGSISAASNALTLGATNTVQTGSKARVVGAGPGGSDLISDVTLLSGSVASLRSLATTTVASAVVFIETNNTFAQRHPNVYPGGSGGGNGAAGYQSQAFPGGASGSSGNQGTGGGGAGSIFGPGGAGGAASGSGVTPIGFGGGGGGGGWKATTGTAGGGGAPGRVRLRPVA